MSSAKTKFVQIQGCAVWESDDSMTAIDSTPNVDNTTISAPEIEFGTTDINLMGTVSVPDFTRIDNFQLSVNIPVDNPDAVKLCKLGLRQWIISYCVSNLNSETGLEDVSAYRIYAKGYITKIPVAELSQGGEGRADLSMNLVSYKKWKVGDNTPVFDIDRLTGKVEVGGVNYSQSINQMY